MAVSLRRILHLVTTATSFFPGKTNTTTAISEDEQQKMNSNRLRRLKDVSAHEADKLGVAQEQDAITLL